MLGVEIIFLISIFDANGNTGMILSSLGLSQPKSKVGIAQVKLGQPNSIPKFKLIVLLTNISECNFKYRLIWIRQNLW